MAKHETLKEIERAEKALEATKAKHREEFRKAIAQTFEAFGLALVVSDCTDPSAKLVIVPLTSSKLLGATQMTRNRHGFSTDYNERKAQPIVTGVLDYFPLAILAVAEVSNDGNAQHNPGEPLHWAREKSQDEVNTAARHLLERGGADGKVRHLAKAAWRTLAALQKEIEASQCTDPDCEVHVHNKDMGGACALLPRAATWYGRTRDHVVAEAKPTPEVVGSTHECHSCKHDMAHHVAPGCVTLIGEPGIRDYCPCEVKGNGSYPG